METRRLITAVLLAFLVWVVLQQVNVKLWPPKNPAPQSVTSSAPGTQKLVEVSPGARGTMPAATGPAATQAVQLVENPVRNDNITLGHNLSGNGYRLLATLSNYGAALKVAQLSEYSETVSNAQYGYRLIMPVEYPSDERYSLGTENIILTDDKGKKFTVDLDHSRWFYKIERYNDGQQAEFWIDIEHDGHKVARVVKSYQLPKNRNDLEFNLTLENLTDRNLSAVIRQEGLVGIRKEDPRSEDRKVFAGTVRPGRDGISIDTITRAALLKLPEPLKKMGAVDEQVVWAGQANKYFAAVMAAVDASDNLSGKWIDTLDARTYSTEAALGEDLSTMWVTRPIPVGPRQKVGMDFELYLGPKSDKIFSHGKYLDRNYLGIFTVDKSWCTIQGLADFMAWLLNGFYRLTHNYGVAIILLVVIVRVVLHPLSKSSQLSMTRGQRNMQRLQPKINALKEKFKNNREALNKATMELYKEEGINPAGQIMGCLPMMLQMPIWFALWAALNNTFELRHQPFCLWIKDLAGPDALTHFSQPITIPLLSAMIGPIHELNILPLLLIASMLIQQVFSPQTVPNPDADPAQVKQQKFMMYFMSLFMGLIFYNAPSGLNLYILTSTLLGVVESKRIRQHLEEEEKRPREVKKRNETGLWGRMQKQMERFAEEYEKKKAKK